MRTFVVVIAVMLSWLSLPVGAQEVQLKFRTEPDGATVQFENSAGDTRRSNLGLQPIPEGTSDQVIVVDRFKERFPDGTFKVTLSHPDFHSLVHSVDLQNLGKNLQSSDVVEVELPQRGPPITLEPKAYFRGTLLAAVLALGMAVGTFFLYRRQRLKAFDLQEWLARQVVPSSDDDPVIGKQLGDFWVLERLGHGGMATVYRAQKDPPHGEQAALKVIHSHVAANEDFKGRFAREIKIGGNLVHPNLVGVYEGGERDGHLYLSMEILKGGTLKDRLKPGGMSLQEGWTYIQPLMEAVAFAHKQGVVHRDLKPDNILFNDEGVLKVADFGLARSQDTSTLTAAGSVLGTPGYMAPEQVQSEGMNPASDQYALGVMIFEILAGRLPFESSDPMQVIMKHLSQQPPNLSEIVEGTPKELDEILQTMLAKDPKDRFPSVLEAYGALSRLV